jgi:Fic family protein
VIDDKQMIFEYAPPGDIPRLMADWFRLYRELCRAIRPDDQGKALNAYVYLHMALVRIHPFFDGNGRLARLVSNLPVLMAGLPPIIIPKEARKDYIETLSRYHFAVGQIQAGGELLPEPDKLQPFTAVCRQAWQESIALVDEAQNKQRARQKQ